MEFTMKIKHIIATGALLLTLPSICMSAVLTIETGDGNAGTKITASPVTYTDDPDFEFQPSTNVNILATSISSSYALMAWHSSTVGTDGGMAYGMASDVSGIYELDISDDTTYTDHPSVAGKYDETVANSGAFADTDWDSPAGS